MKEEKDPFEPGARGGPLGRKKEKGMAMMFRGFAVVVVMLFLLLLLFGEDRVTTADVMQP